MFESNTALVISQAQLTLADLQRKGRGVTIAEAQTRTDVATALSNLPVFLVAVDNTGSAQDDLPAMQLIIDQLLATLPDTHIRLASFGDIFRRDPLTWITKPTDLTGKGDGGGNRHENHLNAVTQMMQTLALGMMGLPGYDKIIGNSTPLPQAHGPVSILLLTDEYTHANGVNAEALGDLDRLASGESSLDYSKICDDFKNGNRGGADITSFVNAMKIAHVPLHVYAPQVERTTYDGRSDGRLDSSRNPLNYLGDFWSIVARATGGTYTPLEQGVGRGSITVSGLGHIKEDVERLVSPAIKQVQLALPSPTSVLSM